VAAYLEHVKVDLDDGQLLAVGLGPADLALERKRDGAAADETLSRGPTAVDKHDAALVLERARDDERVKVGRLRVGVVREADLAGVGRSPERRAGARGEWERGRVSKRGWTGGVESEG